MSNVHPKLHVLLYGESGSGKSTCAATFPKPMLVFFFEQRGKEIPYLEPYLKLGYLPTTCEDGSIELYSGKTGQLLIRIEFYHDDPDNMRTQSAKALFERRLVGFSKEFDQWNTVVFDSLSFMERAFRMYSEEVMNKGAKDGRQHYGFSTSELEKFIMWRRIAWPMNVVVLAHTDYDKAAGDAGVLRYKPKTPGDKALRDIGAAFTEMYHTYVQTNDDGTRDYLLQTETEGLFPAATRIHAPNDCFPHYNYLWEKWDKQVDAGNKAAEQLATSEVKEEEKKE